jgi:hypothetical protein
MNDLYGRETPTTTFMWHLHECQLVQTRFVERLAVNREHVESVRAEYDAGITVLRHAHEGCSFGSQRAILIRMHAHTPCQGLLLGAGSAIECGRWLDGM